MKSSHRFAKRSCVLLAAVILAACAGMGVDSPAPVKLSGDQAVPPVRTSASGSGSIKVTDDRSVSGSVQVRGIAATAANIVEAAPGQAGEVVAPLKMSSQDEWTVPPGVTLTESQYESFKTGKLYVNVHSEQHKDGEIRGQIRPNVPCKQIPSGGSNAGFCIPAYLCAIRALVTC